MHTIPRARVFILAILLVLFAAIPASAGTGFAYVAQWGSTGSADGQFNSPLGGDVDSLAVYVADFANDRVQVFTPTGDFGTKWGTSGAGTDQMRGPIDLAIAPDGTIYVSEYTNNRIHVFTHTRTHADMWGANGGDGTPGTGDGEFDNPLGVAVDRDGYVYVADGGNDRVQKFDGEGALVNSWGTSGTSSGEFDRPWGIAVSDSGRVYVTDYENHRVQVFTIDGGYIGQWGTNGTAPGQFNWPTGVDVDPQGNVMVAEFGNSRVQVFTPQGDLITWFGSYGTGDGQFDAIDGLCLDGNRNAYVLDYHNDRVQQFAWQQPSQVASVAGDNRVATAIAASVKGWPDELENNENGMKTAIVTTARNWPDALGGAGLAGAIDAPILLVQPDELPLDVAIELGRLEAEQVYILGGRSAVSEAVETAIDALPFVNSIVRFDGADRYETANLIAAEITSRPSYSGNAFIATGENFPDALAAAPVAAHRGWPIYLTRGDALPPAVKSAIVAATTRDSWILGGTSAISDSVMTETADALPGLDIDRMAGDTRYATALQVAQAFTGPGYWGLTWNHVALATGRDFPDALAGGPLQGRDASIVLLTNGESLEPEIAAALTEHKDSVYEIRYLGGPVVIAPGVRAEAEALLW